MTIGRASGKPTTLVSAKAATTMMSKHADVSISSDACVTNKHGAMVSAVLRQCGGMWHQVSNTDDTCLTAGGESGGYLYNEENKNWKGKGN